MKKFILFTPLFFFSIISMAQEIQLGAKAGINLAKFQSGNTPYNSKIGFHAGALAHIHASEKWALQPEIVYSLEGTRSKLIPNGTVNTHLSFINIPVLLQYMFQNGLRLEGGLQMGILLAAKEKGTNINRDVKKNFKPNGISIPLGISYLSSSGYGLDARYVFGLSNINKNNQPVVQSNVLQLGLFYQFGNN